MIPCVSLSLMKRVVVGGNFEKTKEYRKVVLHKRKNVKCHSTWVCVENKKHQETERNKPQINHRYAVGGDRRP